MLIARILAGVMLFGSAGLFAQTSITCSSNDMKRHYCSTDTRGGVQMTRQRSGSACRQGYSWDYDRQGIWVDHGCRADFVVGNRYRNGGAYNRDRGYNNQGTYDRGDRSDHRDDRGARDDNRDRDDHRDRDRDDHRDRDHDRDRHDQNRDQDDRR